MRGEEGLTGRKREDESREGRWINTNRNDEKESIEKKENARKYR